MKAIEWSYISYLAVAVPLTMYVARSLYQNGRVFLVECFKGNEELADSVNKLLLVGFYLINLGFVSLYLQTDADVAGLRGVLELLSKKVGFVMLMLGAMHFFNLYLFTRIGRKPEGGGNWDKRVTSH
ncbi:MAG: hypothetical protein ACSHX6_10100 [Akkermansiaceae bacterium]